MVDSISGVRMNNLISYTCPECSRTTQVEPLVTTVSCGNCSHVYDISGRRTSVVVPVDFIFSFEGDYEEAAQQARIEILEITMKNLKKIRFEGHRAHKELVEGVE